MLLLLHPKQQIESVERECKMMSAVTNFCNLYLYIYIYLCKLTFPIQSFFKRSKGFCFQFLLVNKSE